MAALKTLANTSSLEVDVPSEARIKDAIYEACKGNRELVRRVFTQDMETLRSDIIVIADGVDVNTLGGIEIPISGIKELTLIPSVHGG